MSELDGEGAGYGRGHVVIAVFGETASEYHARGGIGEGFVAVVEGGVAGVVYRVERFGSVVPLGGVFARDDRKRVGIDIVAERLEMLVLDDACIGDIGRCVVDDGVAWRLASWMVSVSKRTVR